MATKPASYYYGSTLVARKPVTVYSAAGEGGKVVKQYPKGAQIGKIYSHVLRDGFVWWSVDWFSGKHQGFVLHDPALFDSEVAEVTSQGKKDADYQAKMKAMEEANLANKVLKAGGELVQGATDIVKGAGNTLSMIGDYLPVILIFAILIILLYIFKDKL